MCWDLRDGLRDCLVAAAPYGGPIGSQTNTNPNLKKHFHDRWDETFIQNTNNTLSLLLALSACLSALLRAPHRRSPSSRPELEIYSASGVAITSFLVNLHLSTDHPINTCRLLQEIKLLSLLLYLCVSLPVEEWSCGPFGLDSQRWAVMYSGGWIGSDLWSVWIL